ncbi:hypothetical protein IEQ34_006105 [Dendrobium chrysotoxum]|uniref:Uncharacterized protein n=1 Tax=Dendrobium chrysotoxum TaxID=161865 RepID=A0AAV7HAS8_DENCH|nr:hypothetical protein IEQ34_006105 [Dendrobium chrysotoxum]
MGDHISQPRKIVLRIDLKVQRRLTRHRNLTMLFPLSLRILSSPLGNKFHFPNDLVMKVPARSDRTHFPPPGYVTVYESNLRAGLRFPPSPKLIDILTICGVSLSQISYRAISIVIGLIVLFRDHGVILSAECLSRMGRLFSDVQGRISFRSKWLDIRTRDQSKGLIIDFFYVQNDWKLQGK